MVQQLKRAIGRCCTEICRRLCGQLVGKEMNKSSTQKDDVRLKMEKVTKNTVCSFVDGNPDSASVGAV